MLHFIRSLFHRRHADPGGEGEQFAAEWLERECGFKIIARNWRNPRDRRDELDLVCRDGEILVFVEVKARSASALVPGYYAIDARKKRALRRAASAYLAGLADRPRSFRFDVVEVAVAAATARTPRAIQVLHFDNVPLFPKHFS